MTCPLVFTVNDPYAPYMSVTIQSIIDNASSGNEYIFYVLYRDLREETMERLKGHIEKLSNCSVKFVNVRSYVEGRTLNSGGWAPEVFFKQLAPYVITGHEKLLYLDSDVVVNIDVAHLFEIDMGSNVLAAGRDVPQLRCLHSPVNRFGKRPRSESRQLSDIITGLKNPDDYFNTGVLLFNASAFRNEINFDALMEAGARIFKYPDQDLFNVFCEGKTLLFPIKYNLQVHCWSVSTYLPQRFKAEFAEAKENPALLHLLIKPWKYHVSAWYFPYFWAHAVRSPYFNELRRQMLAKGCICDFADEPFGVRLKRLLKEGKKGRRLAFMTFMKCGLCTLHRGYLS
jgi:lipopolysaccharide biosynthesis glycosyltransferase